MLVGMTFKRPEWGDPASKTFRKRLVRYAKSGETQVLVHKDIVGATAGLLDSLSESGVTLPAGTIPGYIEAAAADAAGLSEDHHARWGLALGINVASLSEPGIAAARQWGFSPSPGGLFYAGAHTDTGEQADLALAERITKATNDIPLSESRWYDGKPGFRRLEEGCRGDDVLMVQLALGAIDRDGVYGPTAASAVSDFQRRYDLEPTGEVGDETWALILPPNRVKTLSDGDAGREVVLLQSCLIAYGWWPDGRVNGRYGIVVSKVVRRLQEEHGLRPNGVVRLPEWSVLLDTRAWYADATGMGLTQS